MQQSGGSTAQMSSSSERTHGRRTHVSLPAVETWLYVGLWLYAALRSVYTVATSARDLRPEFEDYFFTKGWDLLNNTEKNPDYEWNDWSRKFIELIPWTIGHVLVSQLLWWKTPKLVPVFYMVFSATCLVQLLGWLPTLVLFAQPLGMFVLHLLFPRSRLASWAGGIILLFTLNVYPFNDWRFHNILTKTGVGYKVSLVVSAWLTARCLSFCLHRCSEPRTSVSVVQDFIRFLGFCFYFPLLWIGPLMIFEDFEKQMDRPKPRWTVGRLVTLSLNLTRYIFWFFVYDFLLHFVHIAALRLHPFLVNRLSVFGVCGLAYTTIQFFMLKYVVLYGLPGSVARIENYEAPDTPKCTSRMHLSSDNWRYFDPGLYTFLKRCIYTPACGGNASPSFARKLFAAGATFIFLYVWHGTQYNIMLWALLNYVGLVLEFVATAATSTQAFVTFEEAWLSPRWSRRLRAASAVPSSCLLFVSTSYFLLGEKVVSELLKMLVFEAPLFNIAVTLFFMYCMCQVSIEVWNLEERRRPKPPTPTESEKKTE